MLETSKHYLPFKREREGVILHTRGTGSPLEACMIFSSTADFELDDLFARKATNAEISAKLGQSNDYASI